MKEKALKNSRNIRKTVILVLSLLLCSVFLVYAFLIVTFFFVIPSFDNDSQKVESYYGYSHPMTIVAQDDAHYIFAYYTSGSENSRGEAEWTVIDDQEVIRKYKDTFVIYLSEKSFDVGVGRDFFIFKDGKRVYSSNLCYFPYCMIYDDFFAPYEKRLTVEEMRQYAVEHKLDEKLFY